MELSEFLKGPFRTLNHKERIERLVWFLHQLGMPEINTGDIRLLYERAHVTSPNVSQYLKDLSERKPKVLLRGKRGYRLEANVRHRLDAELSVDSSTIEIGNLLSEISDKITSNEERVFLDEALRCYRVKAFRATIVMSWNLAFSHLKNWILKETLRIDEFNLGMNKQYPTKKIVIKKWDDFDDLKEFEVIEICRVSKFYQRIW